MSRTRKPKRGAKGQRSPSASHRRPQPSAKITATAPQAVAPPSYLDSRTATQWLATLSSVADVRAYKQLSYDLLDLTSGQALLDLGCGRGDDVRALAGRVAPGGVVIGVDTNPDMIALAEQAPVATPEVEVRFQVANAERLPFAEATFDAVRVDRVLQHVEAPAQVAHEIARVLRPGGRVVMIEPDWKLMAVYPGSVAGGDDDTTAAAILGWQIAHTRHPLIGRQLGALLHDAGFEAIGIQPVAYASATYELADLVLELSAAGERAAAEPAMQLSRERLQEWIAAARAAETAGQFLACLTLFFARGQKSRPA